MKEIERQAANFGRVGNERWESKGVVGKEHTLRDLSLRREAAALYMIDGRLLLYDSPPITNAWFVSLLSLLFLSVQLLSLVTLSFVNVGFEEARAILTPIYIKVTSIHVRTAICRYFLLSKHKNVSLSGLVSLKKIYSCVHFIYFIVVVLN